MNCILLSYKWIRPLKKIINSSHGKIKFLIVKNSTYFKLIVNIVLFWINIRSTCSNGSPYDKHNCYI